MKLMSVRSLLASFLGALLFFAGSVGQSFAAAECQTSDLNCIMRVGGALLKMTGLNDWTAPYKIQILHLYQKINPDATYDDLVKLKTFVDSEFDKYKGQGSINYETIIQIANDIKNQTDPPIPGATQLVLEMEKSITSVIAQSSTTIENYRQSFNTWAASQAAYANNVLLEVDNYCKENGELCNNLNAISSPVLGVVMGTATPVDVVKSIPALQNDPLLGPIANAVDSNGNWKLNTAETVNLLTDVYSGLRDMNAKNLSILTNTIDAHQENSQNNTIDYVQAVSGPLFDERLSDANMAALEALTDKQSLATAQTAVNVVSMVVGNVLGDSQLASQINTYGGAAIKVASAISGFMDASSGMGAVGLGMDLLGLGDSDEAKMLGMAANFACGNYVGAAMAVFDMFGGGGSGPDPAIMQGIADIRQDIKNLSIQMNTRFDRIDSKLNDIMSTLNTNFDHIDVQLGIVTGDLATIKTQLSDLQQQMSKMEMRIMASLQDTQLQDLNANINSAFNYNADMPYSTWNEMNGWFYTYNKTTASNSTFSNPAAPSIVDAELYNWLNADSTDANINKLAKYPTLKWGLSFTPSLLPAGGNIPNPVVWSKSAEAFLEFSKRHPWYAAADDNNATQWLNNVISEGEKIKRVATAINHNEQGIIGKLVQQSGNAVRGLYDSKGKQLFDATESQENIYYQNNSSVLVQGPSRVDIFGPITQTFSYLPASITRYFIASSIPNAIRLSNYINNGSKLTVANETTCETVTIYDDYYGEYYDQINWWVTSTLIYSGKPISSVTILETYPWGPCVNYSITNWTELANNQASQAVTMNTVATVDAPADISTAFVTHQTSYYQQVLTAFTNLTDNDMPPSLNVNLFEELTGAKQLLQSYLSLGFDRSLQENDYLRYLVYGDKSIFDGTTCTTDCSTNTNSIYAVIKNHITKLNTDKIPLPRLDLATPFYKRSDALAGQLTDIVAAINAGTYKEFQSSIDATLNKLSLRASTLRTLAYNDFYRATPGQTLPVAAPGILANDVQQNGITLKGIIQSLPTHGTLTVNGVPAAIGASFDGGITYLPQSGYAGPDTFTYVAEGRRPPAEGFVFTSDPATVTIMVNSGPPTVGPLVSATVLSSADISQIYGAGYHDPDGAITLTNAYLLVSSSASILNSAILAKYDRAANQLYLYNDAGTTPVAGSCVPGEAATLQNSQATLDCSRTSVNMSGNNLTVTWGITPKAAFAAATDWKVFLKADDNTAASSGFVQQGLWTVTTQPQISLRVSVVGTGGSVSMPVVSEGAITFTVTIADGYRLASITDNGADASALMSNGTVTIADITAAHDLVLTFAPNVLSVSMFGNGSGTVSSAPAGIACTKGSSSGCSAPFADGTVVTLSATPAPGSVFAGWSGACIGGDTCQVTLQGSTTVMASFTRPPLDAACGSSSGKVASIAPSAGLCSFGTPSAVTGNGPWTWICAGEYGGANANCMAYAPVLPRSGQTSCYDATGTILSTCSASGQDGELQMGIRWPTARFVDNQDQTITDSLTGLVWTRDGNHAATAHSWAQALAYVQALNNANNGAGTYGHNDWRLPNVNELASLVHRQESFTNTFLNGQGFINVQPDGYWSASTVAAEPASAWFVGLGDGSIYDWDKADIFYVWPVRGQSGTSGAGTITLPRTGQTSCADASGQPVSCAGTGQDGDLRLGSAWPTPRFAGNQDQTVNDILTGLVWTQDGNAPGPSACLPGVAATWQEALTYISCLNQNVYLGFNDWRLPNSNELASLINRQESDSSTWLNGQGFTNVQGDPYWTATTHAGYPGNAWYVYMVDGAMDGNDKSAAASIWPVRGGISTRAILEVTPTAIDIGAVLVNGSHTQTLTLRNGAAAGSDTLDTTYSAFSGTDASQFNFNAGDGSNGTCGSNPSIAAGSSCTATVTFHPTAGGAKGTTLRISGNNSLPVTADISLTGTGAFNVTPNVIGSNGAVSPESRVMVGGGATATFTVVPAATYKKSDTVTGTCPHGSWNGDQYTTGVITGSCTVGFSFVKISYPLNISFAGTGGGSVVVTPKPQAVDCNGTCSQAFVLNSVVTLTPAPDTSSGFAGWSGACSGTGACQVTMDTVKNATATFAATVNGACGNAHGTPTAIAPVTGLCATGTATAVSGFGPWNWSCDGQYGGANINCSAPVGNVNINVTIAGTGGGSINGDTSCTSGSVCQPVMFGLNAQITLIPLANSVSTFTGWSGACSNASGNCILTMDSDKTVTATFTAASKVKVGTKEFSTIQGASSDAATLNNAVIKLLEGILVENFIFARSIYITLDGGYNAAYDAIRTETIIQGSMKIRAGTVRVKRISIK